MFGCVSTCVLVYVGVCCYICVSEYVAMHVSVWGASVLCVCCEGVCVCMCCQNRDKDKYQVGMGNLMSILIKGSCVC